MFFSKEDTYQNSGSIRELHRRPMLICDTILGTVYIFEGKNYKWKHRSRFTSRIEQREIKVYLNGHAPPLTHIRLHGMDRIPKQGHTTPSPSKNGFPVIYITSKNGIFICGQYQIYHIITPTLKNFQQPILFTCRNINQQDNIGNWH